MRLGRRSIYSGRYYEDKVIPAAGIADLGQESFRLCLFLTSTPVELVDAGG